MASRSAARKPTNLSLDPVLLTEARAYGVNLSQAAESGLRRAVNEAKAAKWKEENTEALEASNNWVETHGLPLAKHRPF
ncbi:type II toxin-antitoxin system CcdA family antitoxin [Nisaea acidiphila]|uniref:Type II toxin-antitoxin system CcdA family antitoxin n=1 Tax=Nisaea acidiphila TaxID=1862145 RepID=A0A9J7AR73_9PROT|nr:type II toxin-antitoxin system CcdA family antitoxin [Nisaea acidiphila]UUX49872.1 type II toxin-antitoxin system CcdA family antitoxin [Nisaea acidiphila]